MYLAIVIFIAIIAVLLILVVLVQNSKGGGLSSEFSGSGSTQMFGVKKTTDLLEQITWGFAGAIMVLALVSYIVVSGSSDSAGGVKSINIEKAQNATLPSGNIAPAPAQQNAAAPVAGDSAK